MTNTKKKTNTITKYTNTHTQHIVRCQKDPTCGIFLKRGLFKGIKNDTPMCQTRKYKDTNTKYTNTSYGEVPERPNMWQKPESGVNLVQDLIKQYTDIFSTKDDDVWIEHLCSPEAQNAFEEWAQRIKGIEWIA